MPEAKIDQTEVRIKAEGVCAGGDHPDPPLDAYPLLAWTKAHPVHGRMVVHTEDQKASVHDIAVAFAETPSLEAVAAKFGTTVDHADQAVRYADAWRKAHAAK
jgi:hypothetical protein